MSVTITNNTVTILANEKKNSSLALRFMADAILALARSRTPLGETGNLRNNTLVQVLGPHGIIQWNTAYAQYQERGERLDGSYKVRNYTTTGTGAQFAQSAVTDITTNDEIYFLRAGLI